jgi:anti-sigma factor RsiW
MTNQPLSHSHPDDATLDRLRAGLLDDTTELRAHVEACTVCRQRLAVWDRLARHLPASTPPDSALAAQLRARRQVALAGLATGRASGGRYWTPGYLAMAAAVTAVAIGVGVFLALDHDGSDATPDALSAQADRPSDIYADIDFYLWLTQEGLPENTPGNAS